MTALRGRRVVFVVAGEVFGGAERGALDIAEVRYACDSELRRRTGAANAATTRGRAGEVDVRRAWTELLSDALRGPSA
jgi:hypothetical protein